MFLKIGLVMAITLISSIIIDTILLEDKKSVKIVINKLRNEKKYLFSFILIMLIEGAITGIMEFSSNYILLSLMLFVLYKIVIIDIKDKVINIKLFILLSIISALSLVVDNGVNLMNALLTGGLLFIAFWGISKLTKESIGMGDAMIIGVLGVIFGFQAIAGILLISSLLSSLMSVFYLIKSLKNKHKAMAFTPFIYISILILLFANNI